MSSDQSTEGNHRVRVDDEEGTVDTKVKKHVLNLRAQIDQDERQLFVEYQADPSVNLPHHRAEQYWAVSIRQYLRGIKRLSEVDDYKEYWQTGDIGRMTLVPPDRDGYRFSLISEGYSEDEIRRALDLPLAADIPKPKTTVFQGLQSILDASVIQQQWIVTVDDSGPPPQHERITLQSARPIEKAILEDAVELADEFLQQAGIGFDISVEPYMGQGEPGL